MMRRGLVARVPTILLALLSVSLAVPSPTAAAGGGVLSSPTGIVRWSGASEGGLPFAPVVHTPQTCALAAVAQRCDAFELTVDLPAGTFTERGDGVWIAIRWATNFLQWNMFVYAPDGSLAASANDVDSNGQAVLIPQPVNGRYTVLAVAASPEPMTYDGEARVVLDGAARMDPDTLLAPRLWTVPPYDLHVACAEPDPEATPTNGRCADVAPVPSNPSGWRWGGAWTNSCFADEAPPGSRCLRFSNNIRNAGDGPLMMRAVLDESVLGGCRMQQIVLRADGTEVARDGGACEYHAAHGHFHYLNTAQFSLLPAPDDTTTAPDMTAGPVAEGRKMGYCLVDIDLWAEDASQLAPRRWSFPTCNVPRASQDPVGLEQQMGISRGWGDVYTWDLPGQFLDITNVPDGTYDLVSFANPECDLLESAPGLEGSATRIRLRDGTVDVVAEFGPFAVAGCTVPTPS